MTKVTEARLGKYSVVAIVLWALGACSGTGNLPLAPSTQGGAGQTPIYRIGPGDGLRIFVWRNEDLSAEVPVRPDGRISVPLLEDVVASGKSPSELSREIEVKLARFVKDPLVTVIVVESVGAYSDQVRIVGEATNPKALPYRANMTLLDAIIEVGGLTQFASGNRSTLVRASNGEQKQLRLRIDDLIRDGEIDANVDLLPGDIIIIPQAFF